MNYKEHLMGGLVVTVLTAFIIFYKGYLPLTIENGLWFLVICFFFSLLPDVDIGTSMISKVITIISGLFLLYIFINNGNNYFGIAIALVLIGIQFLHHRGMAHNLITGLLLSACLYLYFQNLIFPLIAMLNFLSHLLLDGRF